VKTATIFNIQRFSLHDGPGIRTTVFVKGCPLRCAWCHNPESMDPRREPMLAEYRCVGCDLCEPVCPEGLTGRLDLERGAHHPGMSCLRCGKCAEACPSGAREWLGEDWAADALVKELRRDAIYHGNSGGGITFSGGEPLTPGNAPFVLECLEALASERTHTAVDTCGHVPTGMLLDAAGLADLILYDVKLLDAGRHVNATGQDNALILSNLAALLETDCLVWLRLPLIAGQTDDEENLNAIAQFLKEQDSIPPVYLLPYHGAGQNKYTRLGLANALPDTPTLNGGELEARAQLLRRQGLQVHIGG
jgi:pyruvate formate lyase activating enzyme